MDKVDFDFYPTFYLTFDVKLFINKCLSAAAIDNVTYRVRGVTRCH